MAAGSTKDGLPHRKKPIPKKAEAKSLKRKRGEEDLGKLKAAVEQLVSMPYASAPLWLQRYFWYLN